MTTDLALVRINARLRNVAKARAADQGVTLQEWIEEAIRIAASVDGRLPVAVNGSK